VVILFQFYFSFILDERAALNKRRVGKTHPVSQSMARPRSGKNSVNKFLDPDPDDFQILMVTSL